MRTLVSTYIPRSSPVHACDARVKMILLLAYSITLFAVRTWTGLVASAAILAFVIAASRLPALRLAKVLAPLYAILAFTLAFSGLSADVSQPKEFYGFGGLESCALESFDPVPLIGTFGFVPTGFEQGAFIVVRIGLLAFASMVLAFSTPSNDLLDAFRRLLSPLRFLRVPVDDVSTVFSLAVRFMPVLAEEYDRVRAAQWSRASGFETGGLFRRLRTAGNVLIPLFVGLFRHAERLAVAMESRCYGASNRRSSLARSECAMRDCVVLACGLLACVVLALGVG